MMMMMDDNDDDNDHVCLISYLGVYTCKGLEHVPHEHEVE